MPGPSGFGAGLVQRIGFLTPRYWCGWPQGRRQELLDGAGEPGAGLRRRPMTAMPAPTSAGTGWSASRSWPARRRGSAPGPLAPQRQRADRVAGDLQHLEASDQVAFPQGPGDRMCGDRQQGALAPVEPPRGVDPAASDRGGVVGAAPHRHAPGVRQPGRTEQVNAEGTGGPVRAAAGGRVGRLHGVAVPSDRTRQVARGGDGVGDGPRATCRVALDPTLTCRPRRRS
jgi:hypothetical protein